MEAKNKKNKNQNVNLYVTLAVIIVVVAAVIATATVANRKGDETTGTVKTGEAFESVVDNNVPVIKTEKPETTETEAPVTTEAPVESESAAVTEEIEVPVVETEATQTLPEFMSPASGVIINPFSDTVPVFSNTMNDYRTHTGVDISATEGEAVYAAAEGVIGAIYNDPLMGTCVTIVHPAGAVSTYKGLYETIPEGITQGTEVEKGQVIGAIGDTALIEVGEEPHVHYELSIDGVAVDPCLYISFDGTDPIEG